MGLWLLLFFVAFNVLEATLPSLVSRTAHPAAKGAALGVYNTTQALGLFIGGAGVWLRRRIEAERAGEIARRQFLETPVGAAPAVSKVGSTPNAAQTTPREATFD